jgi:hypothetical protein
LDDNINNINKNAEVPLESIKQIGVEVTAERTNVRNGLYSLA